MTSLFHKPTCRLGGNVFVSRKLLPKQRQQLHTSTSLLINLFSTLDNGTCTLEYGKIGRVNLPPPRDPGFRYLGQLYSWDFSLRNTFLKRVGWLNSTGQGLSNALLTIANGPLSTKFWHIKVDVVSKSDSHARGGGSVFQFCRNLEYYGL